MPFLVNGAQVDSCLNMVEKHIGAEAA